MAVTQVICFGCFPSSCSARQLLWSSDKLGCAERVPAVGRRSRQGMRSTASDVESMRTSPTTLQLVPKDRSNAEGLNDLHSLGSLRLFEGTVLREHNANEDVDQASPRDQGLMFVGGSVWGMDWCPCVSDKGTLYLAVAALPQGREETLIGVQVHNNSVIQIWAVSARSEEQTTLQASPCLEFLIAVDSEAVHSLAWCPWPSASSELSMGLLAVAGGGGASWVFEVPWPTHVRAAAGINAEEGGGGGGGGDSPPIVKLRPWVTHRCAEGHATGVAWSAHIEAPLETEESSSRAAADPCEIAGLGGYLAVGGTDGCTTILPCATRREGEGQRIEENRGLLSEGIVVLGTGERNGVTCVAWLERGARYVATGHYDGRIRVWDVMEPLWAIHQAPVVNPGWVTAITWVDHEAKARPRGLKWGLKAGGTRRTRYGLDLLPGIAYSTDAGAVGVLSGETSAPVWAIFERPFPCWDVAFLPSTLELFAASAEGTLLAFPLDLYHAPAQSPDAALLNSVTVSNGPRRLVLDGSVLHPPPAQNIVAVASHSRSTDSAKDKIKNFKGMVEVDEAAWPQGIKLEAADAGDAEDDMDQEGGPPRKKKRKKEKGAGSGGGGGEAAQADELMCKANGSRVWAFPELDAGLHRVRVSRGEAHIVAAGGRAGLVLLRCMPKLNVK